MPGDYMWPTSHSRTERVASRIQPKCKSELLWPIKSKD